MPSAESTRLIVPLTATSVGEMCAQARRAQDARADAVEFRVDFLPALPAESELAEMIASAGDMETIVTCRPLREGGRCGAPDAHRLAMLTAALAAGATWVDVELDTAPALRPTPERTILSHHDFDRCPPDLDAIAARLQDAPAAVAKIAFAPAGPHEALRALDVLRSATKPTIALAMGEAGLLTRLAARKFGAFGTFATLDRRSESAPGQPTVEQLRDLYRWDAVTSDTPLLGVVGCPVGHSMSPAIHNAAMDAAGCDGLYVPLRVEPGWEAFAAWMHAVDQRPWLNWRGLSVTIPHKENALRYIGADHCDPLAVRIGAVNTVTYEDDGSLRGDNTDYAAAIDALCEAMDISREQLAGRSVAVLGAGGAARALVAALTHYGAEVTVANRTIERARSLAEEFGASPAPLEPGAVAHAEVLINCTPLGMHPKVDAGPIPAIPSSTRVVFDTIYNPVRTKLLRLAEEAGATTVTGVAMFVGQGAEQFERWMPCPAPRDVMKRVLLNQLGVQSNG
ncbi:MAG: type I 3-dehydroquinate dehydratase [Phycisphaerae bacterium]